jgi:hypothetical protein
MSGFLKAGSSARAAAAPNRAAAPPRNSLRSISNYPSTQQDFYQSKSCSTLQIVARQHRLLNRADLLTNIIENGGFLPTFVMPDASWVR